MCCYSCKFWPKNKKGAFTTKNKTFESSAVQFNGNLDDDDDDDDDDAIEDL